MEIFNELALTLGNTGQVTQEFLRAFLRALQEADLILDFQDLWFRDVFKESIKEVFLKMNRTVFSSGSSEFIQEFLL
jgi:hypothetical protein